MVNNGMMILNLQLNQPLLFGWIVFIRALGGCLRMPFFFALATRFAVLPLRAGCQFPKLFVILKKLSSEYQLDTCGNFFCMPRF